MGYIRVSTARQEAQGVSLDAQKQAIAGELERKGWELVGYAQDALPATKAGKKRPPQLARAIERLDNGEADALVVARLDRVSRSVGDFASLLDHASSCVGIGKKSWELVLLDPRVDTSTPYGRAMCGVASVFAQLERELIGQRTREGLAQAKLNGTWSPPVPMVTPEVEKIIVRARGRGRSYGKIRDQLNAEGIPAPRGGLWGTSTIAKTCKRLGC